ncbi:MAG: hypothetical protein NTZ49_05730 [Candidatus Parcubacteria bacterium]|nr:hypothetical protein [Candidatus Parcubacteria bacterium]
MKKFTILVLFCLLIAGCAPKKNETQINQPIQNSGNVGSINNTVGNCTPGAVDVAGYGDKGKRLANCFIEFPGEPSRQDKSYYIVEDICGQFTKEFMENILGNKLAKIVPSPIASLYNCSYYLDDKQYVMLVMDYLSVADQKKGREYIGHTIKTDDRIPMENFYAVQENGIINTVYLVLGPEKFISIERSSSKVLEGDEVLQFASRLGQEIKNYK